MRWFWLLVLLLIGPPLHGAEPDEPLAPFPGVAEVVPRLTQLSEAESKATVRINELTEVASLQSQLKTARIRQQELKQRLADLGSPEDWSLDRLGGIHGLVTDQNTDLNKLLQTISERLRQLDTLRQGWNSRLDFWRQWRVVLEKEGLPVPPEAISKALDIINGTLARIDQADEAPVALQQEISSMLAENQEVLSRIDQSLDLRRRQIFQKTAHSFFSPAFYDQLTPNLWEETRTGINQALSFDPNFLPRQGWILAFQGLLALILGGVIHRYRQGAEVTAEWEFLVRHPWVSGIFVSIASLSLLYTTAPPLFRLALALLVAFSAAVLVSELLHNPRKIFMVRLLAALFIFSLALKIIALPAPLYRLYLASLALLGSPLLFFLAVRNLRAKQGHLDGFTAALRLGGVVLLAAFFILAAGYVPLASRLIESSVETVFLVLLAAMTIRLGRGGFDFLFSRELLTHNRFFSRYGDELSTRLKGVFKAFVLGYVGLYLLVVWGIFNTVGQGWSTLLDLSFSLGTVEISVQMILLALLVLYLSIVISWTIQAFLETEVFPRKRMDRGIRNSIRKLLHYSLIFIGFLLAVTMAGVELKNFAVLAGAFGIGIGFGLQNVVNNFISGLILLFERPIKIGDIVVIDEDWGTVKKIGLRSTIVETLDQSEVIVPNSQLISEKVVNWTLSTKAARITVPVGVAYGSDIAKVLEVLLEVGNSHPDVLKDPPPSPIFIAFGESSLDFQLRAWLADINKRLRVKSDLCCEIDRRFRESGIEIPFPQRDLHLRSVDDKLLRQFAHDHHQSGHAKRPPASGDSPQGEEKSSPSTPSDDPPTSSGSAGDRTWPRSQDSVQDDPTAKETAT